MPASVLLIDDDDGFSASILARFRHAGIDLDRAQTWEEGFTKFSVGQYELVIADYNLPGSRHGLMLLAKIKIYQPTSRLILISGALTQEAEELIPQTNLVDRFLSKRPELADQLLDEAEQAEQRMTVASDWQRIAAAYVSKADVDATILDEIDRTLRSQVGGTQP